VVADLVVAEVVALDLDVLAALVAEHAGGRGGRAVWWWRWSRTSAPARHL
jgi:hypothetical protein